MSLTNCLGGCAKLNTDYCIPMVGLGTYKTTGQEAITAVVDAALKAGYRLFDTAKLYVNEPELGKAFEVNFERNFFFFCQTIVKNTHLLIKFFTEYIITGIITQV